MKRFRLLILLFPLFSCNPQTQKIEQLFTFPEPLKEVSGINYNPNNKILYVIEDSGNLNRIYGLNLEGKIVSNIEVENTSNTDWEDLSQDKYNNLYLGDFGNNKNERTDLCIYKIDANDLDKSVVKPVQKTTFYYPEQENFPPKKKELLYDCEAFITTDSAFYLFTKNRSKGFDGSFFVYKVPNKDGHFRATKIATLQNGNSYNKNVITGAAYHFNTNIIALITHTEVILIPFVNEMQFNQNNLKVIELNHNSQKESVTFKDEKTLLIGDEKNKKNKSDGAIYQLNL